MTTNSEEQIYCSVDLEFTGFDPSRDQILEIGFAFFKVSEKGFEVQEQWSQVFKSSIEVHPKILGLTGITQEELDAAPEFNDHREFLQEKLGNAIIVGHNPVMDVKFLEAYGIKLSGKTIDTLELVQFILPTHHSYNLENLVHYFGVKHAIAHRALGDALSTISVLENLVHLYGQFSDELKSELQAVVSRGEFLWNELIQTTLEDKIILNNDSLNHISSSETIKPILLSESLVIIDEDQTDHEARVAKALKLKGEPSVLAVTDSSVVMRLWKDGLVHGVFRRDDTFSKYNFNKFLEQAETPEQLRFCLKIIVWMHTNWQTEVVFDLNISFFGGQFRQFIIGGELEAKDETVLCVDFITLQTLSGLESKKLFAERKLMVCGLQQFEKYISTGFGTRLGWNGVLYALRMVYNPETDFGNASMKQEVLAALASTDLFFGLVYMLLEQSFSGNQYVSLSDLVKSHEHILDRLQRATENLLDKLKAVSSKESTPELNRVMGFLKSFFNLTEGQVKWVTLDENNLSLHDQPLEIAKDAGNILKAFKTVQFTDTIAHEELLSYLVGRLGLHTEQSEFANKIDNNNFSFATTNTAVTDEDLFNEAQKSDLPLVIVFTAPAGIKAFYNKYYPQLKEKAALFAQGYSGGGNKMFRNFSIKPNSILLVTAEFMEKQNYIIPAKTIVFTGLPPVEASHPYVAALLLRWKESYPNLLTQLSHSKILAALKKIKVEQKVSVHFYNFDVENEENIFFVDNSR